MNHELLQICSIIIYCFSKKKNLSEFELLAYEQVCRTTEVVFKIIRKSLEEVENESEDYQG